MKIYHGPYLIFSISGKRFKVRLSPSKKNDSISLIESLLKVMKNASYFILKALFFLTIFKFLFMSFGRVGKTA